jgi:hypothetical protein
VIALAAGITVVGLVAWTVNGALGGGSASQSAQVSRVSAGSTPHPAATSRPAASAAGPTPAATPDPSAGPGHHASAPAARGRQGTGAAGPGHSGRAGHGPQAGPTVGTCPGGDVVLSLFAARYSYPAHAQPQFQVDAVSTAPGTCTFALGAGNVQLLVKAGGLRRVWDSADCARPAVPQAARLAKGVPAVLNFTWDRETSAPGCRLPRRAARPGTYTATAYSGQLSSQSLIFVLRAPGIGVP